MPPLDDPNYAYGWRPENTPRRDPLLHDNVLWHFIMHPKGSIYTGDERRHRLPKRNSPLKYHDGEGFPVGWGVEWVEGFNWWFFYHCELLLVVLTIVFTVLFCIFSKGNEKVMLVLAADTLILTAGQVGYMIVLGLSEYFCFWRY
jgi:hypothetical protein